MANDRDLCQLMQTSRHLVGTNFPDRKPLGSRQIGFRWETFPPAPPSDRKTRDLINSCRDVTCDPRQHCSAWPLSFWNIQWHSQFVRVVQLRRICSANRPGRRKNGRNWPTQPTKLEPLAVGHTQRGGTTLQKHIGRGVAWTTY